MILELDCGNTRVKWRVRYGDQVLIKDSFRAQNGFGGIIFSEPSKYNIKRVLVSSVLGDEFSKKIIAWSLANLGVNPEFAMSEEICGGVINGYQQPEKLGVDRWLSILAVRSKGAVGCVIIDCGSAITVDVVSSKGEHLGGYIAPGIRLMREILNSHTSAIKFESIGYPDTFFPGRNTIAAIKAAELSMIAGLVAQAKKVLFSFEKVDPALWITGGDGAWLSSMIDKSMYEEDLVLNGLAIALNDFEC